MPPITIHLRGDAQRHYAKRQIDAAPANWEVVIKAPTRTGGQNSKLWPMLDDVSTQIEWYGRKLTQDNWKDIFTAALRKSDVAPGLDGGFVVLGQKSSTLTKQQFNDLITLMYAFGAERGVIWSEPSEWDRT
jgi:hypothetical protein